ncbi:hypothetical protein ACFE04_024620 [Oxalis oulophora]
MDSKKTLILILLLCSIIILSSSSVSGDQLISEKEILLEFKSTVFDPFKVLSTWNSDNNNNNNHCSWFGVTCNSNSKVVSLNLTPQKGNFYHYYYGFGMKRRCFYHRKKLSGQLSSSIGLLTHLRVLSLACNQLHGQIPIQIWGLEKLQVVDLEGNLFTGQLPHQILGLTNLRVFNLAFNRIDGKIPASMSKFVDLEVLNLSGNKVEGNVPRFLAAFPKLKELYLADNQLNVFIPTEFGSNCRNLKHLDLSGNFLIGQIRGGSRSRSLLVLDHSQTKPQDQVPTSLHVLSHAVSSSVLSSRRKISESSQTPPSVYKSENNGLNSIELASIVSASAIISVLLMLIMFYLYVRRTPKARIQVAESREITIFSDILVPLTFENIVKETANFNPSRCIGNGGFGATYKAEICGTVVAVKRLAVGRFQGVQQFHAEIKSLERVKHPNLVTLIGYHASETEMFLIYNYLPGGNLENFIRERSERDFGWKIVHKIALDVASGLFYLHDQCSPKVLHRDVKPSNILLDGDSNAYLSDFGLARLLGTSQTHATTGVAGTFGYVAPEYAMTCRVSEKADVYSYGVVLLEMLSDKKPLDPSFSEQVNGFNIVSWASLMLRQGQAKDVFTAGLWDEGPHDHMVEMLYLAIQCTVDSLSTRPTMRQVVRRLQKIQPS